MEKVVEQWIEGNKSDLVSISDKIWSYAELGLAEHRSAKVQKDYLESLGFRVKNGPGSMDTAFVASWGKGKPVVAFLGEYDALPMLSNRPVPYAEPLVKGGPGHGCGHNLLGVASLAGAAALKELMQARKLDGAVRYYGCPAEETSFGKPWMVRDGAFHDVDIALTWHPGSINSVSNSSSLADMVIKFNFYGKTAHAASAPWNGRSALDGVELMNAGIERMREHILPESRIHYIISHGGGAPNVVPDFAQNSFDIRATDIDELKKMYGWVLDIGKGAALMTQTKFEPVFLGYAANVIPNRVIAKIFHSVMEGLGSPKWSREELDFAKEMQRHFDDELIRRSLDRLGDNSGLSQTHIFDAVMPYSDEIKGGKGSTDVGDVSWVVPTAQFTTACCVLGTPGHSWAITSCSGMSIGHKGMLFAAKILGITGYRFLIDSKLRDEARSEWKLQLKGKEYESLIPSDMKEPPMPCK